MSPDGPLARLVRPAGLAGLALAVVGLAAATLAASLALDAGEPPATALPFARAVAEWGLAALLAYRALSVAVLWLAVDRLRPRLVPTAIAGAGLFWLLWGAWGAWLLLART